MSHMTTRGGSAPALPCPAHAPPAPRSRTSLRARGVCLLLATLAFALVACNAPSPAPPPSKVSDLQIGGPFQLVDTEGRVVTDKSLLGKPTALFFGFTYCPDICPTTLFGMTEAMAALGPAADALNVVLISLDPERDSPEHLKAYLTSFDPRIQGFTGTRAQVDAAAKAYRVHHHKIAMEGEAYSIDHSAAVYLFDADGKFVAPLSHAMPPASIAAHLRRLIGEP